MPLRKVRILLIDNDKDFLDMLHDLLMKRIENLSITGVHSIEKALKEIDIGYFDIAVIDKRLVHDPDPEDESGIELANKIASQYPWLKMIMLTAFESYLDITKKLPEKDKYGEPILCGYISKKEESHEWCSKIKSVIESSLGINFDLKIELDGFGFKELGNLLVNIEFKKKREISTKSLENLPIELSDLFGKIYYENDEIRVTPVGKQGYSGTGVVKVHSGQNLAEILKFGERDPIEIEYGNYREHVARKIPNRTIIDENKFAQTKNLGAIAYYLIGADINKITDFSEYYQENDPETIINFLDTFFKDNCRVWYSNPGPEEFIDLKNAYEKYLKIKLPILEKAIKLILGRDFGKRTVNITEFGLTMENPIYSASHALFPPFKTRLCRNHGDLNAKNILVDKDSGWLIDFYSTGWGHSLRDFITLETRIKFELTKELSLSSLVHLEKNLLTKDDFDEEYEIQGDVCEKSLEKLFKCIKRIRKLAHELTASQGVGEYYVGLFFTTLKMLQFYKDEGFTEAQNKKRLKFIFISAGLIYQKLKELGFVSNDPDESDGATL